MNEVVVDQTATFRRCIFMGAQQANEWNEDRNAAKKQKTNRDGVPIWLVEATVKTHRDKSEVITIEVGAVSNPANDIEELTAVRFVNLRFRAAVTKNKTLYTAFEADGVQAVAAAAARGGER